MQAVAAPERTRDQRLEALAKANAVRTERSAWKRRVKRREADALPVLLEPPVAFENMKVVDVLLAMPRVGRVKANRILRRVQVSPAKTVGGLSPRQRSELVTMLTWR